MLAERREMLTAKRTPIRRRLAVRRAPNGPPWRRWKAGHAHIVAPLFAGVAVTAATTAALRLGVAAAVAERERRAARARKERERHFALLPGESAGEGLKRMALAQLDLAIEMLAADNGAVSASEAVHEARKALKRLRALLALLSDQLGEEVVERDTDVLRRVGRRLAGARDAEVMVATLDDLVRRHPQKLAGRPAVHALRERLAAERDRAAQPIGPAAPARTLSLSDLYTLRARVGAWQLDRRPGIAPLAPAVRRIYRGGLRRFERARAGRGDRAAAMHRWRKRVKELRYVAEALSRFQPDPRWLAVDGVLSGGPRRRNPPPRRAAFTRRLARGADKLSELVGAEHDLRMLEERVRAELDCQRDGDAALLKLIRRRRKRLRRRALKRGGKLYRLSPKKLVRRLRAAYAAQAELSQQRPGRVALPAWRT
jgi:CHAD domain-containing protein